MHVDVHQRRVEFEEEHGDGMPVARHGVGEGAADRAGDQLVAHRTPVHIGVLRERIGAAEGGYRDPARKAHPFAFGVDGDRILGEFPADDLRDAAQHAFLARFGRRKIGHRPVRRGIAEADLRKGHGDALDHVRDGACLGALALHEF
jgi:hypothetical protein